MDEDKLAKLRGIAKNPIKEDQFKKLPAIRRFMMSDGVEEGDYPVPAMLIYDRYFHWCEAFKLRPLSVQKFFKEFAMYADKKAGRSGLFYMLSPKGFDLSPQYLELVRTRKWNVSAKEKKAKEKRAGSKPIP